MPCVAILGAFAFVVRGNEIARKRARAGRLAAAQPLRRGPLPAGYAARFMVLLNADPTSAEAIGVRSPPPCATVVLFRFILDHG